MAIFNYIKHEYGEFSIEKIGLYSKKELEMHLKGVSMLLWNYKHVHGKNRWGLEDTSNILIEARNK